MGELGVLGADMKVCWLWLQRALNLSPQQERAVTEAYARFAARQQALAARRREALPGLGEPLYGSPDLATQRYQRCGSQGKPFAVSLRSCHHAHELPVNCTL